MDNEKEKAANVWAWEQTNDYTLAKRLEAAFIAGARWQRFESPEATQPNPN